MILICFLFGPLIKIEDKGPIFYFSERLGMNKKSFRMIKLRSMKVNSQDIRTKDNETFNSPDDERLTKIGKLIRKLSIDETPQLINVLLGDMSIIGPRPNLDDHEGHVFTEDEIRRLEVRPGITGYNQAFFRNSIPKNEKFKNDVYYVDNISFLLDLKIFLKTISTILRRSNVYNVETEN